MKGALFLFLFQTTVLQICHAHESRPAYLEIKQSSQDTYSVLWKVPGLSSSRRLALNLRLPQNAQHQLLAVPVYINGAFVHPYSLRIEGGLDGEEIYIEGLAGTLTDVIARVEKLDGSIQTTRLTPDRPFFTIEAGPDSFEVSQTYSILGIQHILKGIDHLLFIGCLLLVAGIGKRLLITITGFTIAHSLTLALAVLGIVRVPIPPVEAAIALSIVFMATEIVRNDKSGLTYRFPVAVSVSFGLLHGFGFAAVLNQIGLPVSDIPLALLFFNLGVEIGQLLFIGAWVIAYRVLVQLLTLLPRRSRILYFTTEKSEKLAVYLIGATGSFWLIERVSGFL